MDDARLRLYLQAGIAFIVLLGTTLLAYERIIDSGAVIALYGSALGAVGVGIGLRGASPSTTQHFREGGTLTTEHKDGGD